MKSKGNQNIKDRKKDNNKIKRKMSIITVFLWIFLVATMVTIVSKNITNTNALESVKDARIELVDEEKIQIKSASNVVEPNFDDIEMNVGETASHWSYPRRGFYCNYDNTLIAYAEMYEYGDCYIEADDYSIIYTKSQGYDGDNDQYLKTTLEGLKGGITNYEISTRVHMVKSGSARCPKCGTLWRTSANNWYDFTDSWTVTVYDTFKLNYNVNGGNGTSGSLTQREAQEYYTFSDNDIPTPTKSGYKFIGWSTDPNATVPDIDALEVGPSPTNISKTVYAVWEENYATLVYKDGDTILFEDKPINGSRFTIRNFTKLRI